MDSRQSLVVGAKISPDLSARLHEELKKNPDAVSNLRSIAARAIANGRFADAWLVGLEAKKTEEMAKEKH